MFSGIIKEIGTITAHHTLNGEREIIVSCERILSGLHPGSSVSVNGVCLTVQTVGRDHFTARLMPHTIEVTTLGGLNKGSVVNLETALAYGDELGGHLVYGHVDGIGTVTEIETGTDATLFTIQIPEEMIKYIVQKGAIAIDGVSLTVSECPPGLSGIAGSGFAGDPRSTHSIVVSIVPYTFEHTVFKNYRNGSRVNIEVDMMAKHIEKFLVT